MTNQLSGFGYSFAVPALIMRALGVDLPEAASVKRVPTTSDGFDIVVDVFSFTDMVGRATAIETLMKRGYEQGRELVFSSCEIGVGFGVESCTMLVASKPSVEFLNVDEAPTPNGFINAEDFVDFDLRQIGTLSRFTGLRFVYCYSTTLSSPPFPEKPGTVYLFYHRRPPGICNDGMVVDELFGMKVWEDGIARQVNIPTRGRGRLIYEGETPIFQVLGFNYYVLCLTHTVFHGSVRDAVVRKLLGCMYHDLVES